MQIAYNSTEKFLCFCIDDNLISSDSCHGQLIFKTRIKIFLTELVCLLCRRDQQMKRMEMKVMMMK